MKEQIIYCADVIAEYEEKIVLIRRLNYPKGLALPGGHQEREESLCETVIREFFEETGLFLRIKDVLGTFAEENRDPRGRYVSTVFIGEASGTPKDEQGKTKVIFIEKRRISEFKDKFVFDHWKILENYLKKR